MLLKYSSTSDTSALPLPAVENISPASLTPHTGNARTHSKRQIKQIANSIKEFGFNNPVLIDRNSTIVAGHGRVEAAKLLQLTTVPTLRLDHLTPDQVRAYIIADNRLAENAGWDNEILKIELQHLLAIDSGFDVTVIGFDTPEIDFIIEGTKSPKAETIEPESFGPAVCKLGDLWNLGPHRIICGNALEASVYQQLMQKQLAHAVFTDPPYNVAIDGHASGLGQVHHREFEFASGEMSETEFTIFLNTICRHLAAFSHPGSLHYICMDFRHDFELQTASRSVYTELKNLAVWVKDNAGMGSLYRSQHELILIFKNGKAAHQNNVQLGKFGRNRTNVWNYPGVNAFARQTEEGRLGQLHPTVKPVAMVADAILDCTARRDIVLDAFLGSGTTLLAAERVGRVCRAIEIDPQYVDLAIRRWQRYTGGHAIHTATGRRFDAIANSTLELANE